MEILVNILLILGLVPHALPLVIRCDEVDSIDLFTEANSEILFFWDCATREQCRGKVIRYNGEKHWSCTTATSQGQFEKYFTQIIYEVILFFKCIRGDDRQAAIS